MRRNPSKVKTTLAVFVFAIGMLADARLAEGDIGPLLQSGSFTSPAGAVIGRPLTPLSYAGVARRTTRRVVRRTLIYAPALPPNCVALQINGVASWQCGATYYQASGQPASSGNTYVVVNVED